MLARITPGVTSLIPDGGDRYKATFVVALGPFKNTFNGQVEIADKQPPEAMTLKVQARGPGGGVAATGRITLREDESDPAATRVAYTRRASALGHAGDGGRPARARRVESTGGSVLSQVSNGKPRRREGDTPWRTKSRSR